VGVDFFADDGDVPVLLVPRERICGCVSVQSSEDCFAQRAWPVDVVDDRHIYCAVYKGRVKVRGKPR